MILIIMPFDKLFSSVNIKKSDKENLANAIQPEETIYMRGMEHFDTLVSSIKNPRFIYPLLL